MDVLDMHLQCMLHVGVMAALRALQGLPRQSGLIGAGVRAAGEDKSGRRGQGNTIVELGQRMLRELSTMVSFEGVA